MANRIKYLLKIEKMYQKRRTLHQFCIFFIYRHFFHNIIFIKGRNIFNYINVDIG